MNAYSEASTRDSEVRNNVYVVASNWYVNRCPLVTRIPTIATGSWRFTMANRHAGGVVSSDQYCERFSAVVPLGPAGRRKVANEPFDSGRMDALGWAVEAMERSSLYGAGNAGDDRTQARQKGLRTILKTNRIIGPTNAAAYKAVDFIRDALVRPRENGGDPDVLIVSSNFMIGFAMWGHAVHRIDAGVNVFGTPIDVFECPAFPDVSIIEDPMLDPFTAVSLTSGVVVWKAKSPISWNPVGEAGSPNVGEFVAEGAIVVTDEQHHAWIEGITAFSAV